jgi:hypothetical protein
MLQVDFCWLSRPIEAMNAPHRDFFAIFFFFLGWMQEVGVYYRLVVRRVRRTGKFRLENRDPFIRAIPSTPSIKFCHGSMATSYSFHVRGGPPQSPSSRSRSHSVVKHMKDDLV